MHVHGIARTCKYFQFMCTVGVEQCNVIVKIFSSLIGYRLIRAIEDLLKQHTWHGFTATTNRIKF